MPNTGIGEVTMHHDTNNSVSQVAAPEDLQIAGIGEATLSAADPLVSTCHSDPELGMLYRATTLGTALK